MIDFLMFNFGCVGGHLGVIEIADIWCGLLMPTFAIALWAIILAAIVGIVWLTSKLCHFLHRIRAYSTLECVARSV